MIIQTKEGHKICSKCKVEKPFSDFFKCVTFTFGVHSSCKECVKKNKKPCSKEKKKIYTRRYYEKNKERIKKNIVKYRKLHPKMRKEIMLKHQYGISLEHYENIQNSQNGFCAICGIKPTNRVLYVDHCHSSNKIRGLLCIKCNSLLGFCNDNIEILKKSISYLEKENNHGYVPC